MKLAKKTFYKIEWLFLLLSLLVVAIIIRQFPEACELWTRTISRTYITIVGSTNKYLPFSITELIFLAIIAYAIYVIISLVIDIVKRKKDAKWGQQILSLLLISSTLFSTFMISAGVSYGRNPVDLPQYREKVDYTEYKSIVYHYLNDMNYCASVLSFDEAGEIINPYSHSEMNILMEREYAKLDSDYFSSFTNYSKPMMSSFLYREFQITGVSFLSTGEINYNYAIPNAELPFTLAHETAHQKGVSREEDAQLTALYITLNSDVPYFRYSGYLYSLSSLMVLLNFIGDSSAYGEAYRMIDNRIKTDYKTVYKYWSDHNLLANFSRWWNNLFLIFNGQSSGIESYTDNPDIDNEGTEDDPIYVLTAYSPYQKLFFALYYGHE